MDGPHLWDVRRRSERDAWMIGNQRESPSRARMICSVYPSPRVSLSLSLPPSLSLSLSLSLSPSLLAHPGATNVNKSGWRMEEEEEEEEEEEGELLRANG